MATVTFVKYTKQSAGALRGVARYVSQEKKTDGQQLVSGLHCFPQFACQEFLATRHIHHKNSPVYFYHYVQSFHPDELITGEQAHAIAKKFASKAWPESEVLIATHIDAKHIHSHFIINAVCCESGRMLRQGPDTLSKLRSLSDQICFTHGLSVITPKKGQTEGMSSREYRSAAKGESWKFQLMAMIDDCMKYARSKHEFIALMNSEGYGVCWETGRKSITYTCPNGMKCRDKRLHQPKYLKEMMEHEFRIRAEIIYGRTEAAECSQDIRGDGSTGNDAHTTGPGAITGPSDSVRMGRAADDAQRTVSDHNNAERFAPTDLSSDPTHTDAPASSDDKGASGYPDADGTGWEAEREILLAYEIAASANQAQPDMAADPGDLTGLLGNVAQLGYTLERMADTPVADSTVMSSHTDSKALKKQREKRIAMGHKADDHEEQRSYQQTMY